MLITYSLIDYFKLYMINLGYRCIWTQHPESGLDVIPGIGIPNILRNVDQKFSDTRGDQINTSAKHLSSGPRSREVSLVGPTF